MRTSRFTDEQIIGIVGEYEAGEKLTDLCRRHNVSPAGTNPWGSGTGRARKQLAGDCLPFGAVIACRRRTSGTPVPVGRVAEVALDPMQVRVDPGAGGIGLVLLDDAMGSVPVALAEMPQRAERSVEACRRRLADERGL